MEHDEGMFKQVADRLREQRAVPEGAVAKDMGKRMGPGRMASSKAGPRRQMEAAMLESELKNL